MSKKKRKRTIVISDEDDNDNDHTPTPSPTQSSSSKSKQKQSDADTKRKRRTIQTNDDNDDDGDDEHNNDNNNDDHNLKEKEKENLLWLNDYNDDSDDDNNKKKSGRQREKKSLTQSKINFSAATSSNKRRTKSVASDDNNDDDETATSSPTPPSSKTNGKGRATSSRKSKPKNTASAKSRSRNKVTVSDTSNTIASILTKRTNTSSNSKSGRSKAVDSDNDDVVEEFSRKIEQAAPAAAKPSYNWKAALSELGASTDTRSPSPTTLSGKAQRAQFDKFLDLTQDDDVQEIDPVTLPSSTKKPNRSVASDYVDDLDTPASSSSSPSTSIRRSTSNVRNAAAAAIATATKTPLVKGVSGGEEQWVDKYAPTTIDDLCVHSRKIKDVRAWLETNLQKLEQNSPHAQTVLMLDGPAGSAKSALLRVIAQELGCQVTSWNESHEIYQKRDENDGAYNGSIDEDRVAYEPKMKQFKSFFVRAKKYGAVTGAANQRRLVLVEELPYTGKAEARAEFLQIVRSLLHHSKFITAFVFTDHHEQESDKLRTFDDDILHHPRVKHITTNPISATGLRKALQRVISGENIQIAPEVVESIVETCSGDVRNAIHSLQFECLLRDAATSHSTKGAKGKTKSSSRSGSSRESKSKKSSSSSSRNKAITIGRDETYSVFHAMGKILYAKREADPETVVKQSDLDPSMFLQWLHANFLDHVDPNDMDSVVSTLDYMSHSDLLAEAANEKFGNSQSSVPESASSAVACRAFLLAKSTEAANTNSNASSMHRSDSKTESKSKSGSKGRPMRGPMSGKVNRLCEWRRQQIHGNFLRTVTEIELGVSMPSCDHQFMLDTLPYVHLITSTPIAARPPVPLFQNQQSSSSTSSSNKPAAAAPPVRRVGLAPLSAPSPPVSRSSPISPAAAPSPPSLLLSYDQKRLLQSMSEYSAKNFTRELPSIDGQQSWWGRRAATSSSSGTGPPGSTIYTEVEKAASRAVLAEDDVEEF